MKITFSKESLLHDISNIAYVIADVNGRADPHAVHQTFDIVERGNIDRVARMLCLAFAVAGEVLSPLLREKRPWKITDETAEPRNLILHFSPAFRLKEILLRLIETATREFLVCHVIADWLTITLPDLAPLWREKANLQLNLLHSLTEKIIASEGTGRFGRRPLHPF